VVVAPVGLASMFVFQEFFSLSKQCVLASPAKWYRRRLSFRYHKNTHCVNTRSLLKVKVLSATGDGGLALMHSCLQEVIRREKHECHLMVDGWPSASTPRSISIVLCVQTLRGLRGIKLELNKSGNW
jgi:hypothetical protein